MFVEGSVEILIKDRSAYGLDDHEIKLWVHGAFRDLSCYRISAFSRLEERIVRATVALKVSHLTDEERHILTTSGNDSPMLRSYIEQMFDGKGACRCISDPRLTEI